MSSSDPIVETPNPKLAAAVARAERLRDMLERLAVIGMAMAEELGERHATSPYHSEPRHDPGRSFAGVSRAVRLTAALVIRLDADILAMCNGELPPRLAVGGAWGSASSALEGRQPFTPASKAPPCPKLDQVREAVHAVIDGEVGDVDVAMLALDRAHETLAERDAFDRFLEMPLRACVAAICADLGLDPDWSRWSDEAGFVEPEAGQPHDWSRLWTYDPDYLEARRKRKAERPPTSGKARPAAKSPSPLAGEGGPRSGSDEGSTISIRVSC
jgi:hypothetical protein